MSETNIELFANKFTTVSADKVDNTSTLAELDILHSNFIGFEGHPAELTSKIINRAYFKFWYNGSGTLYNKDIEVTVNPLIEQWNPATISRQNEPSINSLYSTKMLAYKGITQFWASGELDADETQPNIYIGEYALLALKYGLRTYTSSLTDTKIYTSRSSNKPSLKVYFSDEDNYICIDKNWSITPSGGYIPKYKVNTFSWYTNHAGWSVDDDTLNYSYCRIKWRENESATVHTIAVNNPIIEEINPRFHNWKFDVPSGTFLTDDVEYCIEVIDTNGHINASDWIKLTTVEAISSAETLEPANNVVEVTKDVLFRWQHIIRTGTDATRSDLQLSNDGAEFTDFVTVTGAELSYLVPANTISTGNKFWRVRTYNTDNVAGEWSDPVSFIALGQPIINSLSVDSTPKPTIKWQSDDFVGYQIKIDGISYGINYGNDYYFKSPKYLNDGTHTVELRLINQYGIWSDWHTTKFEVSNIAGLSITLELFAVNHLAVLRWNEGYSNYIVYRDGKAIAKTTNTEYTDIYAIGEHTYFVRGINANSNYYGISNTETILLSTDAAVIADVKLKEFLSLRLSAQSIDTITFGMQTNSNIRNYSGAVYPVAELSKQKAINVTGRTVFANVDDALKFEAMIGRIVCYKVKNVTVIGLLTAQTKRITTFYTEYDFSISQTEFEEDVEE